MKCGKTWDDQWGKQLVDAEYQHILILSNVVPHCFLTKFHLSCFRDIGVLPIIGRMTRTAALGAAGWDQPGWADNFYPTDMPEDWRLTYYNTQFSCVYLGEQRWRGVAPAEFPAWAADTHDHFVFLLEGARPGEIPEPLAGRCLGVAPDDSRLLWFDRQTSLKMLSDRLAGSDGDAPIYLISRDGDLGQIERVRTLLELLGL